MVGWWDWLLLAAGGMNYLCGWSVGLVVGFGGGFVGWGSPTGSVLLVRSGGCSVVLY